MSDEAPFGRARPTSCLTTAGCGCSTDLRPVITPSALPKENHEALNRNACSGNRVDAATERGRLRRRPVPPSCPKGFEVKEVDVLEVAAEGFEEIIKAEDENKNGLLCFKEIPAPLFEPITFFFTDDSGGGFGKP